MTPSLFWWHFLNKAGTTGAQSSVLLKGHWTGHEPSAKKKNALFLPAELSLGVGMGKAVRTLCQGPTDTSINAVVYPKYQWQVDGFGLVLQQHLAILTSSAYVGAVVMPALFCSAMTFSLLVF